MCILFFSVYIFKLSTVFGVRLTLGVCRNWSLLVFSEARPWTRLQRKHFSMTQIQWPDIVRPRTAVVISGCGSQSSQQIHCFLTLRNWVAWSLQTRLDWTVWTSLLGDETLSKEDSEGVEVAIIYHQAVLPLLSFCHWFTPSPHSSSCASAPPSFFSGLLYFWNWQLFFCSSCCCSSSSWFFWAQTDPRPPNLFPK